MGTKTAHALLILAIAAAAVAIAWGVWHGGRSSAPMPPQILQIAATTSATPSAPAATKPLPPTDFLGVVRDAYPDFAAAEPLAIPAELHEAARLILSEPIYLDSLGGLWITRSDAPAIQTVLKSAADAQVHLTRERVLFVHLVLDDADQWQPQIVCADADGNFVLISSEGRLNLGRRFDYQWDRAFEWNSTTNEGFVVPTSTGISVFRPRSLPVEMHYDFAPTPTIAAPTIPSAAVPQLLPQALLDTRGLLAWIPWDEKHVGSQGTARFVDGQWQPLGPEQGWPQKLVHLVPLIGGGVEQLVLNDDGTVTEQLAQLDAQPVDPKVVDPLIDQLSDPDPAVRDTAFNELTRYGPGLWPILEKVIDDQPPEGHLRIQRLLAAKQQPTLGHMTLLPGKVRVLARLEDGGALLMADAGVSLPSNNPAQPPLVTAPAFISIRPGRPIELAPPALVADLPPDAHFDVAPDEWIVTDAAHGPRRLLGNHLEPLLRKSQRQFSRFIGIDRKGRWLFRQPGKPTPTLLLDPNLPDVTPHLAAWIDPLACDAVGWDDAGWPVFVKGGSAWALHAEDWFPLPTAGPQRKVYESLAEMNAAQHSPNSLSPSNATTHPSPILVDGDGTRYFDGRERLTLRHPDGSTVHWKLPPEAVGNGEVRLLKADGRLFLFNEPGRVVRIAETPHAAEPFKLEATFTRQIPNADHFTRIWLDPAGRIDMEYDKNRLTILFPNGRIPRGIAEKMPEAQLKDEDE